MGFHTVNLRPKKGVRAPGGPAIAGRLTGGALAGASEVAWLRRRRDGAYGVMELTTYVPSEADQADHFCDHRSYVVQLKL